MAESTRDTLLRRARELFNERGVEAVGPRDLARDLGLSPGNVSYYFPRKQDLVLALMDDLSARNEATVGDLAEARDLAELLGRYRVTFETQYEYRGITRAIVPLVESDPAVAERHRASAAARRAGLHRAFAAMVGRDLRPETDRATLARLVASCSLTARFWSGEALLSFPNVPVDRVIDHYVALMAHALWGPATVTGRAAVAPFLTGALEDESLGEG